MKILIAGDFAPKERIGKIIRERNEYGLLDEVKSILSNVDYSIVNLEAPYSSKLDTPIIKKGPHLHSPKAALKLLKDVGFRACTLANNHINDYGECGIFDTLAALQNIEIDSVGIGDNINDAKKILYKTIQGKTVAFISICENEYSIATKSNPGAAPINPIINFYQIKDAKKNADYVIVITHGGHEHFQLPSPRMKELFRFYIDIGADAVINHHQHCYSGYETYLGKPIIYGLGNFLFDSQKRMHTPWNYGYMAILKLKNNFFEIETVPYKQSLEDPRLHILNGEELRTFEKKIIQINDIISNDDLLEEAYDTFITKKKKAVLGVFSPYPSEYIREVASRGMIPNLLSTGQISSMLNYIMCESQRDVTIGVLKNLLKSKI